MQCITGEVIDAFRFLSDQIIVTANTKGDGSLDLFTLPEPTGDASRSPMTKIAQLWLPDISVMDSLHEITFWNPPAKDGIPRSKHYGGNATVSPKPFTNSPDNIIHCCIMVLTDDEYTFSVIVHSSALLRHATPQHFNSIPWNEWSPSARFTEAWRSQISGQRMLTDNEIWDFNQYRVRRLGRDFAAETETAHISVVIKESRASAMDNDASGSSLPYVRIVPKQWKLACLDDDRIFTAPVSTSCSLFHSSF
jgi:hypothetical protein